VSNEHRRVKREKRTVEAMIRMYCTDQQGARDHLCQDCQALLTYSLERLERCPFQEGKTTCAKCPVHCYRPAMRERIRAVMRYAGPRMLVRHPILAVHHLIDGLRTEPTRPADEKGQT
jgi:hypothetical protein